VRRRELIWLLIATVVWLLSVQAQQVDERTLVLGNSLRLQAGSNANKIAQFIGEKSYRLGRSVLAHR